MKEERKSEFIQDALDFLDEDMIEEVDHLRGSMTQEARVLQADKKNKSNVTSTKKYRFATKNVVEWIKYAGLVASVCLVFIGAWALERIAPQHSSDVEDGLMKGEESQLENIGAEGMEGVLDQEMDGVKPDEESDTEGMTNEDDAMQEQDTIPWIPETDVGEEPPVDASTQEEEEPPVDANSPEEEEPLVDANTPEGEESVVLGDLYNLRDNYVQVSMLPHKVWESAASEAEAIQQAVVIEEGFKEDMDKLLEAMCEAKTGLLEELPPSDPDMIYHIFFERSDGKLVHCWLLEDGHLYFHENSEHFLMLDRSVYANTFRILALHW